jgi:hypothetical protein
MPSTDGQALNEFQRPDSVPPGGVYFYELSVSEDSPPVRFESHKTVDDLVWQVQSYCQLNNVPSPGFLKAKVVEFMCENLPPGFCRHSSKSGNLPLTLTQVKEFTNVLFRRAVSSAEAFFTTKEEAEKRASVCTTCPLNDRTRCTVCGGLLSLVRKLVGRRETSYDPLLGTCSLCGCLLRVKVHISSGALKASTNKPPEDKIPGFCWLNEVYK